MMICYMKCSGVIGCGLHYDIQIVLQLSQLFQRVLIDLRDQTGIDDAIHRLNGDDTIRNWYVEICPVTVDAI